MIEFHTELRGKQNTLLDALNKSNETSVKKGSYEKIDKEADKLIQAANNLIQSGENSVFEQAKTSNDYQKVYDGIEKLFERYNGTLKALKSTPNTMNSFYREMMLEAFAEMLYIAVTYLLCYFRDVDADVAKQFFC